MTDSLPFETLIRGPISEERKERLRKADEIFKKEVKEAGFSESKTRTTLPHAKAVGVMGDNRTYEGYEVAIIHSEETLPFEVLRETASRIVNEVPGLNRVFRDITVKEGKKMDAAPRKAADSRIETPSVEKHVFKAPKGNSPAKHELLLIFDFGGQYTQNIARTCREQGVHAEIWPHNAPLSKIRESGAKGIILAGGPNSVYDPKSRKVEKGFFELGIPILGICYGAQLMAHSLGGKVAQGKKGEYGRAKVTGTAPSDIATKKTFNALMSHTDEITDIPEGFTITGKTDICNVAMMQNPEKKLYALQFHPEVALTEDGKEFFKKFIDICGFKRDWQMRTIIDEEIARIKETVKDGNVICALSGGVDSMVAAALVYEAVGDNLTCIFVDTGLMRKNEAAEVRKLAGDRFGKKFIMISAQDRFLDALEGETSPEKKRKIIGEMFIRVFEEKAEEIGGVTHLVQGTIYPDIIESVEGIKSHHNVGGLPEKMGLKLVEPLKELFKDEVRVMGIQLGLPHKHVFRQPFPGPGLGVRVTNGPITREKIARLQEADAAVREEIESGGVKSNQFFAAMIGENIVAMRAVETTDFMTAEPVDIPEEILNRIACRIEKNVKDIKLVAYDITPKPPGTIEME